jgi:SAM-dependent methyltransferase
MSQYVVEFGNVGAPPEPDGRLDAPAFHRNCEPIWSVLAGFLHGQSGDVLELGSGTGQHVIAFARQSPGIRWWPSDLNEQHLRSIAAWRAHSELANVEPPVRIDLTQTDWGLHAGVPAQLRAIVCANVLHIAPWRVAEGLFAGAARHLADGGRLFIYGPFVRDGAHTAPSNAAFDASLRSANPEWGVRDTRDLRRLAAAEGLSLVEVVEMPANNAILVFGRA